MTDTPDRGHERGRALLIGLFVVYLVLLVWLVLWKYEVPWIGDGELRTLKLVPFAPSRDADSNTLREVIANFAFFVPFGIYVALLAPRVKWWAAALVFASASVLLEAGQFAFAVGSSDVTDVITNTLGGLAGVGIVALLRARLRARTLPVMTRVCAIGTVVAVLATAIFIASPLHYGPQRDAAPLAPSHQQD